MPLSNESIMVSLCTLNWSFNGQSNLTDTGVEVLIRQTQFHLFDSKHFNSDTDQFPRETTVWIHGATITPHACSMAVRPHLQSQLHHAFPMQIELPADHPLAPFSASQPSLEVDRNELVKPSPMTGSRDARYKKNQISLC